MSRPHDGHRPFSSPFGNPFRVIFSKKSYLSQRNLDLLNAFEGSLAKRLRNLKLVEKSEVLGISWMRLAMESLCETHTDIKTLITDLQFPISYWDENWMNLYLDSSVHLLDICIAFTSELTKLNQSQLFLQCVRQVLDNSNSTTISSEDLVKSSRSLDEWNLQTKSRNKKLENCSDILIKLTDSLHLVKFKNSARGKVLMRAMYGVMIQTIFICGHITAVFSGSSKTLMNLQVSDKFLWAEAFNHLQTDINIEVRTRFSNGSQPILKDLEEVEVSVKKLYPLTSNGLGIPAEPEILKNSVMDLGMSSERLSKGVDLLSKEVENFFQVVLSGRDALLCNLRVSNLNSKVHKIE